MTKSEASEKIAKLQRLASGTTNIHEAANAQRQIDKLKQDFQLSESDLQEGRKAAAFDDLVDQLGCFAEKNPTLPLGLFGSNLPTLIQGVLDRVKKIPDSNKASHLTHAVTLIKTSSFFVGNKRVISELQKILHTTLKNHNIDV